METSPQSPASPAQGTSARAAAHALTGGASRSETLYPDDQPKPDVAQPQHDDKRDRKAGQQEPPQQKEELAADPDYQLKMPEGIELDQDLLNSAVPALRDAGISSEQANKLVPLVKQVQERFQRTQLEQFSAVTKSWKQEAKTDREIGGQNWTETGRLAGVALEAGGAGSLTHEVRQILNESSLGDHPAMVRLFRNMGAEIERLRNQKGVSVDRESGIEAARRHHQKSICPNDPPQRSFAEKVAAATGRVPRSRSDARYPDDQPKR